MDYFEFLDVSDTLGLLLMAVALQPNNLAATGAVVGLAAGMTVAKVSKCLLQPSLPATGRLQNSFRHLRDAMPEHQLAMHRTTIVAITTISYLAPVLGMGLGAFVGFWLSCTMEDQQMEDLRYRDQECLLQGMDLLPCFPPD